MRPAAPKPTAPTAWLAGKGSSTISSSFRQSVTSPGPAAAPSEQAVDLPAMALSERLGKTSPPSSTPSLRLPTGRASTFGDAPRPRACRRHRRRARHLAALRQRLRRRTLQRWRPRRAHRRRRPRLRLRAHRRATDRLPGVPPWPRSSIWMYRLRQKPAAASRPTPPATRPALSWHWANLDCQAAGPDNLELASIAFAQDEGSR